MESRVKLGSTNCWLPPTFTYHYPFNWDQLSTRLTTSIQVPINLEKAQAPPKQQKRKMNLPENISGWHFATTTRVIASCSRDPLPSLKSITIQPWTPFQQSTKKTELNWIELKKQQFCRTAGRLHHAVTMLIQWIHSSRFGLIQMLISVLTCQCRRVTHVDITGTSPTRFLSVTGGPETETPAQLLG